MASINLLPWREEFRQDKKKEFVSQLIGVCIIAALCAYVWISSVDKAIANQKSRNAKLSSEISILDKKVTEIKDLRKKRQELLDRMRVIQDLQGTRPVIVRYFDEFSRAVPDGVFVTAFRREGEVVFVEGVSESNNRVSRFMRQLDASKYFDAPSLRSVVAAPNYGEQSSRFSMQVNLVLPVTDEEAAAAAEGS